MLLIQENLSSSPTEVNVAQSLGFCVMLRRTLFVLFSIFLAICVVCPSICGFWLPLWYLSYGFWLPLWYLQTLRKEIIFQFHFHSFVYLEEIFGPHKASLTLPLCIEAPVTFCLFLQFFLLILELFRQCGGFVFVFISKILIYFLAFFIVTLVNVPVLPQDFH
jgi:hypothetical protein